MKEKLFIILIFLFLFNFVSAIEVTDLSDQISTGNQKLLETNALLNAEISQIKQQVLAMDQQLKDIDSSAFKKDDIPRLVYEMNIALYEFQRNLLIMLLVLVLFVFAGVFYSKSKGWV